MEKKVPITAIIVTKNEEANLDRCLSKCSRISEIYVVDSISDDNTVKIAEKYLPSKNIIKFQWNHKWPMKRQWSLTNLHISNEWVLMLDADEIIEDGCLDEIDEKINQNIYDAFMISFSNFFKNKELKFGDQMRKICLFKREKAKYALNVIDVRGINKDTETHEHPTIDGKIGLLKSKIQHYDSRSIEKYIQRHDYYSTIEANRIFNIKKRAKNMQDKGKLAGNVLERRLFLKRIFYEMPFKPFFYFVYSYIIKWGFLDGMAGFEFVISKCDYLAKIDLKLKELRKMEHRARSDKSSN